MRTLLIAIVASLALSGAPPSSAQSKLTVAGVPGGAPYRVRAESTDKTLKVTLDLDTEWHAYSRDVGGGRPVSLVAGAGSDFAAAGPAEVPDGEAGKLDGVVTLSLPLVRVGEGHELRAELALQVCDALQCLLPTTLTLEGEVEPLDVRARPAGAAHPRLAPSARFPRGRFDLHHGAARGV
jgi:hypothetical protein